MRILLNNRFSILFLLSIFTSISCSKDSDDPDSSEISVTASNFSISMDENPVNGQVIGTVSGSTNEGVITFSITEQNPAEAFSINAVSGELIVADKMLFDFETNPIITGTVNVTNESISQNAMIIINLNDLFENPIYEGSIQLKTQQEVNDFGTHGYNRIAGTLEIGEDQSSYSDITDLTPLSTLKNVDGDLYIAYNGELITTAGLENISSIGANIGFTENPMLEKIEGLQNITEIYGSLIFSKNLKLKTFNGLNQIRTVANMVSLFYNPEIKNLNWLSNLESIGQSLGINYNAKISNIEGLSNLTNIGNSHLSINENQSLENLDGLENLMDTITHLSISKNPSLLNINGVRNITPTELVRITDNDLITSISILSNIVSLNYLTVEGNASLLNLEGLNNLHTINNDLSIGGNLNLKTLNGLSGLINVSNEMKIIGNHRLENLCELRDFLTNGNLGSYAVYSNFFNPTKQEIIDGNCSL